MEYLNKVLGIKVTYEDVEFKHLPNFIVMRYRLQMAFMNGKKAIFLYPKTELEQIGVLKKHIARIQKNENLPVVLVLKEIISRQKEYLIREKIPFVVEGRQIYLPFMALYLQEWCNAEREQREEMRPSAQMLLLHFIMDFSLLSPLEFFVDPKNVDGRNNKPPAMRVRVDCYTKKLPFRVQ